MRMRMVVLYFSGTGNSKFIARHFAKKMGAECHSIEEKIDFKQLFDLVDTVAVVYPIYGSCVPRIMREFVALYMEEFQKKKLIILLMLLWIAVILHRNIKRNFLI